MLMVMISPCRIGGHGRRWRGAIIEQAKAVPKPSSGQGKTHEAMQSVGNYGTRDAQTPARGPGSKRSAIASTNRKVDAYRPAQQRVGESSPVAHDAQAFIVDAQQTLAEAWHRARHRRSQGLNLT